MVYDFIIIGAGAAGLFAGATLPSPVKGLIIEKNSKPGRKLLLTGSGQCNLTHGGSIKDFIDHYGTHGRQIRSILYHYNNLAVISFFEKHGISITEREDGKMFPKSFQAQDILNTLVTCCIDNGLQFSYSNPVTNIGFENGIYTIVCRSGTFFSKKVLIAAGGCSYPSTGSDGSMLQILEKMGVQTIPTKPALAPIHVEKYPYDSLSGISFQNTGLTLWDRTGMKKAEISDAVLFTHNCFSGPGMLKLSRYAEPGDQISICYLPEHRSDAAEGELFTILPGNKKLLSTVLSEYFNREDLPKRFLEAILIQCRIDPSDKASHVSGAKIKSILKKLTDDRYVISGCGGFRTAMATSGGVSLNAVQLKTLESTQYAGLYFAGEILDVDGDTGGYNLQFAFSSGYLAAEQLAEEKNIPHLK